MANAEIDRSEKFNEKITSLSKLLDDFHRNLTDRTSQTLAKDIDTWEKQVREHKVFEDKLQSLDHDVAMVQELFRQLENASPTQRTRRDQLLSRWKELWESSRLMAERLQTLELVLTGLSEASQIVTAHEVTLGSFSPVPPKFDDLCGIHSQLLQIQLILQQQQPIFVDLKTNIDLLRQHVTRSRSSFTDQSDVSRLKEEVNRVTSRWDAICGQVVERLKSAELCLQRLMIYRSGYDSELNWLDRVEESIGQFRSEGLRSEKYQEHFDLIDAEYSQLHDRARAVEKVNLDGRKFIADARVFDTRLSQFKNLIGDEARKGIDSRRRHALQAEIGADVIDQELDQLNKRFSHLSSLIGQRRNHLQSLIKSH